MMIPSFSGRFLYRSFRNGPIDVSGGEVAGSPVLAEPWAPVGTLDVKTDAVDGQGYRHVNVPARGCPPDLGPVHPRRRPAPGLRRDPWRGARRRLPDQGVVRSRR